ncbi:MAG: metallophosphatase [Oceanospirillaceae bacterium]|nr:metallophosphatase [Oceanospirillaceae bacterium]
MRILMILLAAISWVNPTVAEPVFPNLQPGGIAFGSCLKESRPQPIWTSVLKQKPAGFVFMGDTVYADVGRYKEMKGARGIYAAWQDLAVNPEFSRFMYRAEKQSIQLMATWDDHDYGLNDAGEDFPHKLAAKDAMMNFFGIQKTHTGGARQAGVYDSHRMTLFTPNRRPVDVQVILLDTRSFRSELVRADSDNKRPECKARHAVANEDPLATVLGEPQWQWLEKTLKEPADLRLLVSSIQALPEEHCYEKWANFPHERIRLLKLIRDTRAKGVVLLSGDRHLAEISLLPSGSGALDYPLYEVTSSGLNSAVGAMHLMRNEANSLRTTERSFGHDNFGYISLEDTSTGWSARLSLVSDKGHVLRSEHISW